MGERKDNTIKSDNKSNYINLFMQLVNKSGVFKGILSDEEIKARLEENIETIVEVKSLNGIVEANYNMNNKTITINSEKYSDINLIHEMLHALSLRTDKEGKIISSGIQKGKLVGLNEGLTDYLAEKMTGKLRDGYYTQKRVISLLTDFVDEKSLIRDYLFGTEIVREEFGRESYSKLQEKTTELIQNTISNSNLEKSYNKYRNLISKKLNNKEISIEEYTKSSTQISDYKSQKRSELEENAQTILKDIDNVFITKALETFDKLDNTGKNMLLSKLKEHGIDIDDIKQMDNNRLNEAENKSNTSNSQIYKMHMIRTIRNKMNDNSISEELKRKLCNYCGLDYEFEKKNAGLEASQDNKKDTSINNEENKSKENSSLEGLQDIQNLRNALEIVSLEVLLYGDESNTFRHIDKIGHKCMQLGMDFDAECYNAIHRAFLKDYLDKSCVKNGFGAKGYFRDEEQYRWFLEQCSELKLDAQAEILHMEQRQSLRNDIQLFVQGNSDINKNSLIKKSIALGLSFDKEKETAIEQIKSKEPTKTSIASNVKDRVKNIASSTMTREVQSTSKEIKENFIELENPIQNKGVDK